MAGNNAAVTHEALRDLATLPLLEALDISLTVTSFPPGYSMPSLTLLNLSNPNVAIEVRTAPSHADCLRRLPFLNCLSSSAGQAHSRLLFLPHEHGRMQMITLVSTMPCMSALCAGQAQALGSKPSVFVQGAPPAAFCPNLRELQIGNFSPGLDDGGHAAAAVLAGVC